MVNVVCNASPIIGLSILGKLDLLWKLFDVTIPAEVYNEVVHLSKDGAIGASELKAAVAAGNIKVYSVIDEQFVNKAYGILHRGELEVVLAALETNIKIVIIDEKAARDLAEKLNLKPLGIIGILRIAKQKGLLQTLKPELDKLIQQKYRISSKLYNDVLVEVGEF